MPRRTESTADPSTRWPNNLISPAVTRSAPKIARATSVRPEPTNPLKPTISPVRTVRLMSENPEPERFLTSSAISPAVGRPGRV